MRFALQFFLYYVLWAFVLGFGSVYVMIMAPEFTWWFIGSLLAVWILPPVGTWRRRFTTQLMFGLREEQEQNPNQDLIPPIFATMALAMVMILAMLAGSFLAPPYLEAMDVDVEARLEAQNNVRRE